MYSGFGGQPCTVSNITSSKKKEISFSSVSNGVKFETKR
jgi:hypothetical protein